MSLNLPPSIWMPLSEAHDAASRTFQDIDCKEVEASLFTAFREGVIEVLGYRRSLNPGWPNNTLKPFNDSLISINVEDVNWTDSTAKFIINNQRLMNLTVTAFERYDNEKISSIKLRREHFNNWIARAVAVDVAANSGAFLAESAHHSPHASAPGISLSPSSAAKRSGERGPVRGSYWVHVERFVKDQTEKLEPWEDLIEKKRIGALEKQLRANLESHRVPKIPCRQQLQKAIREAWGARKQQRDKDTLR